MFPEATPPMLLCDRFDGRGFMPVMRAESIIPRPRTNTSRTLICGRPSNADEWMDLGGAEVWRIAYDNGDCADFFCAEITIYLQADGCTFDMQLAPAPAPRAIS